MEVDVKCKSIVKIDIDCKEAFRLLVKSLNMEFILDEDIRLYTRNNGDGDICLYQIVDGHDELFDDRGELYNALMDTARCIFPNI